MNYGEKITETARNLRGFRIFAILSNIAKGERPMRRYYLTKPSHIAGYLYKTITGYDFFVRYNRSSVSESYYLNINTGTRDFPDTIHVRISNHSVSRNNKDTIFDYDICGNRSRSDATTYIKFLIKFAADHGKALPDVIEKLRPNTARYKRYAIGMQKRAA